MMIKLFLMLMRPGLTNDRKDGVHLLIVNHVEASDKARHYLLAKRVCLFLVLDAGMVNCV
jgi:hypothetical protein